MSSRLHDNIWNRILTFFFLLCIFFPAWKVHGQSSTPVSPGALSAGVKTQTVRAAPSGSSAASSSPAPPAGFKDTISHSPAPKLYDPAADAEADIARALRKAQAEHKHVLLQAGGNWCSWCIEFNRFITSTGQIDSLIDQCYIVYHLNYSKENLNRPLFAKYGFPQRFGFPVFIILDADGNRLHTQNSEYLEQGRSYNKQKVLDFLLQWTPQALNPALYNR